MTTEERAFANAVSAANALKKERDMALNALRLLVREIETGRARQYVRKVDMQVARDTLQLMEPDGSVIYLITPAGDVVSDMYTDQNGKPIDGDPLDYWPTQGLSMSDVRDALDRYYRLHRSKY